MSFQTCPKCGQEKHLLKACQKCGFIKNPVFRYQKQNGSSMVLVEPDESKDSLPSQPMARKSRGADVQPSSSDQAPPDRTTPKESSENQKNYRPKPQNMVEIESNFQLISKRGTRIQGFKKCDKCDKNFSATWRYKSSKGIVHLCIACKNEIRNIDKPRIDALDLAYTGGRFEGNRRRH